MNIQANDTLTTYSIWRFRLSFPKNYAPKKRTFAPKKGTSSIFVNFRILPNTPKGLYVYTVFFRYLHFDQNHLLACLCLKFPFDQLISLELKSRGLRQYVMGTSATWAYTIQPIKVLGKTLLVFFGRLTNWGIGIFCALPPIRSGRIPGHSLRP